MYIEELDILLNRIVMIKQKKEMMEAQLIVHGSCVNIESMIAHYTTVLNNLQTRCDCLCVNVYADPYLIPF